jgi:hypothetical protein
MSVKLAPLPSPTKNRNNTYAEIKCSLCANYVLFTIFVLEGFRGKLQLKVGVLA